MTIPKVGARVILEAKVLEGREDGRSRLMVKTGPYEEHSVWIFNNLLLTVENPPPLPLKVGDKVIDETRLSEGIIQCIMQGKAWVKYGENADRVVSLQFLKCAE